VRGGPGRGGGGGGGGVEARLAEIDDDDDGASAPAPAPAPAPGVEGAGSAPSDPLQAPGDPGGGLNSARGSNVHQDTAPLGGAPAGGAEPGGAADAGRGAGEEEKEEEDDPAWDLALEEPVEGAGGGAQLARWDECSLRQEQARAELARAARGGGGGDAVLRAFLQAAALERMARGFEGKAFGAVAPAPAEGAEGAAEGAVELCEAPAGALLLSVPTAAGALPAETLLMPARLLPLDAGHWAAPAGAREATLQVVLACRARVTEVAVTVAAPGLAAGAAPLFACSLHEHTGTAAAPAAAFEWQLPAAPPGATLTRAAPPGGAPGRLLSLRLLLPDGAADTQVCPCRPARRRCAPPPALTSRLALPAAAGSSTSRASRCAACRRPRSSARRPRCGTRSRAKPATPSRR
jgi:hypothetical protein